MVDSFHVIPECYVDTNLVSTLLGGIGVNHQKSCNNVIALMRGRFEDDFAVGIIDNDKRRPQYLDDCNLIAESNHLQLYKHSQKQHYIITISPAAEGFILSVVEAACISMSDYNLPSNLDDLKKITKHIVSNKNSNLIKLFRDLKNVGEFNILSLVLRYLIEKGYNADQRELQSLFN